MCRTAATRRGSPGMVNVNANDVGVIGPQNRRRTAKGKRQKADATRDSFGPRPTAKRVSRAPSEPVLPCAFCLFSFHGAATSGRLNAESIEQSPCAPYVGFDLRLEGIHVRKPPFVPEPLHEPEAQHLSIQVAAAIQCMRFDHGR